MILRTYLIFIQLFISFSLMASDEIKGAHLICDCPGIEELSSEISTILNKGLEGNNNPELALEIDKLTLLADIQIAVSSVNPYECRNYQSSYFFEDTKKLDVLKDPVKHNVYLYSKTIDVSKFEPKLLHYYEGAKRTLFLKGTLNNEQVYYKLEMLGNGEAIVSYIPIKERKIPKAIIVESDEQLFKRLAQESTQEQADEKQKDKVELKTTMNSNSSKSTTVIKDTETNQQIGAFNAEDGKFDGNIKIADKKGKNVVEVRGAGSEEQLENKAGLKYTRNGDNTKVLLGADSDQNLETGLQYTNEGFETNTNVKMNTEVEELKYGADIGHKGEKTLIKLGTSGNGEQLEIINAKGELKLAESTTLSTSAEENLISEEQKLNANIRYKRESFEGDLGTELVSEQESLIRAGATVGGEKGKISVGSKTIGTELGEAELNAETKVAGVDLSGGHKEILNEQRSVSSLSVKKGRVRSTSSLEQEEESLSYVTRLDYSVTDNTELNLSYGQSKEDRQTIEVGAKHKISKDATKKTSIAYGTKLELDKDEDITRIEPKLELIRELNKEDKTRLKTSVSAEFENSHSEKIKGRIEWERTLTQRGKVGVYVEGNVDSERPTRGEALVGANAQLSFGIDTKDLALIKVYKLLKFERKNDAVIGYYQVWRYECNIVRKKLKIREPKDKSWLVRERDYLSGLHQVAASTESDLPKEMTIPEGASLEGFCK